MLGAFDLMNETEGAEREEYAGLVRQAGNNALELANKLLTFSRKEARERSRLNIHEILNNTTFLLQRTIARNIKISIQSDAVETTILGHESEIQNALLNMGINAAHAMPAGGTLKYNTRNVNLEEPRQAPLLFDLVPGEYIEIKIIDSGEGIPDNVKDKIFDPFFTTKEKGKGTGLGLSAVLRMIRDHNGSVEVSSEVGKGTTFRLLLPVGTLGSK